MNDELSNRCLVENEMLTRANNTKAGKVLGAMSITIKSVLFSCECSQKTCLERVKLSIATYTKLHRQANRFVIKPGHETAAIESVELREPKYWVVQNYSLTPDSSK